MKTSFAAGWVLTGLSAVVAGCVPQASVDARSLTGRPLPDGPMAMLPAVLSAEVQDFTLAAAFARQVAWNLQEAGLDVMPDDLGGNLAVRVRTTQPAHGGPPQWLALTDAQRVEMAQGTPFATLCQPVVLRYGYYPQYVPPQIYEYGPAYGPYYYPYGPYYAYGPYGYGYAYIPGHYQPTAQVIVAFHVFDARTGRQAYYVVARNYSFEYTPGELEKGFRKPLKKAFAAGMWLPEKPKRIRNIPASMPATEPG